MKSSAKKSNDKEHKRNADQLDADSQLAAIQESHDLLKTLGFPCDQSSIGIALNYHRALKGLGFTLNQIFKIKNDNDKAGHMILNTLIENHDGLHNLLFNADQIMLMINHKDGIKNLSEIIKNYTTLKKSGFHSWEIVEVISQCGANNLNFIIENYVTFLQELMFEPWQVASMVCNRGHRSLVPIVNHGELIRELSIDPRDLTSLVLDPNNTIPSFFDRMNVKIKEKSALRGFLEKELNDLISEVKENDSYKQQPTAQIPGTLYHNPDKKRKERGAERDGLLPNIPTFGS